MKATAGTEERRNGERERAENALFPVPRSLFPSHFISSRTRLAQHGAGSGHAGPGRG